MCAAAAVAVCLLNADCSSCSLSAVDMFLPAAAAVAAAAAVCALTERSDGALLPLRERCSGVREEREGEGGLLSATVAGKGEAD